MSQSSPPWTPVSLSQLPGFKCSTTADLQPATVYFKNNSSVSVEVHWIDYHGLHHLYHTLAPTKEVPQATSTGHPWVYKSTEGKPIAFYIVSATTDCRAVLTDEMLKAPDTQDQSSFNGSHNNDYHGNSNYSRGGSDYSSNNYGHGQQSSRSSTSSRGGSGHAATASGGGYDPRSPHASRNANYANEDRRGTPQYDLRQPYPYHDYDSKHPPAYDDRAGGGYRASPPRGGQAMRGEQLSYDKGPYGRDPNHARSSSSHGMEVDLRAPPSGYPPDSRLYDSRYPDARESHSQSHGGSNTTYYHPRSSVAPPPDPRGYEPPPYDRQPPRGRYDDRGPPPPPSYYDRGAPPPHDARDAYPPPRDARDARDLPSRDSYRGDRNSNISSYRPGRQDHTQQRDLRDTRDLRDAQWEDRNVDLRDQISLRLPKPRSNDARGGDSRRAEVDSRYPPGGSDNRDNRQANPSPIASAHRSSQSSSYRPSARGPQDSSRNR